MNTHAVQVDMITHTRATVSHRLEHGQHTDTHLLRCDFRGKWCGGLNRRPDPSLYLSQSRRNERQGQTQSHKIPDTQLSPSSVCVSRFYLFPLH